MERVDALLAPAGPAVGDKVMLESVLPKPSPQPQSAGTPAPQLTAGQVLRGLWLAGALPVGGWLLAVNLRFARRARRLASACLGIDCPVPVYRLEGLPSPCLAGVLRPRIYVTGAVLADPAALEHVLTHELCHRRQGDNLWALLRGVCLALWWFHPLIWAAAVLSRRDGELSCDEAVLERLGEGQRLAYGRTLVALAARRGGPGNLLSLSTTMTAGKRELAERVRHVARRRNMKGSVLALTLVLAAALAACTFTSPKGALEREPAPPPVDGGAAEPAAEEAGRTRREGVFTFLLAATDVGGGNTDVIMVCAYDTAEQTVGLVSIPRDTLVERKLPKINGIYAAEGVRGLRDAVSDLLGIPIDHYVTVKMDGFRALVDAVGGVDFDIPCHMSYDDPTQDLGIHFAPGVQRLDGRQALEVARFRHNNDGTGYTDVGRSQTQQRLLTAVMEKALASPGKLGTYVDIFVQNVETDLSAGEVLWLATQALRLNPSSDVSAATLPGRGDVKYNGVSWCYQLEPQGTLELVNRYLNPYGGDLTLEDLDLVQAE